jgi:hypothetical protein
VSNLKMQRPFPTFAEARTLLLLEEIDVNDIHDDGTPAPASQAQACSRRNRHPSPGRAAVAATAALVALLLQAPTARVALAIAAVVAAGTAATVATTAPPAPGRSLARPDHAPTLGPVLCSYGHTVLVALVAHRVLHMRRSTSPNRRSTRHPTREATTSRPLLALVATAAGRQARLHPPPVRCSRTRHGIPWAAGPGIRRPSSATSTR